MSRARRIPADPDRALDAELHVLGALLLDGGRGDVFDRVAEHVTAGDFGTAWNRVVWEACEGLVTDGLPIDAASVCDRMSSAGAATVEEAGEYVLGLAEYVATTVNIEHHAKVVREYADLRALVAACQDGIARAQSSGWQSATEVIEETIEALMSRFERKAAGRLVSLKAVARDLIVEIKAAHNTPGHRQVIGAPCGVKAVDRRLRGFRPGHMYIIGARPAMGKTAVAVAWASGVAMRPDATALYVSAEIPARDIGVRLYGALSGANTERLETGDFGKHDNGRTIDALTKASMHIADFGERLQILDMPAPSLASIRQAVRQIKRRRDLPPLRVVFVDYLQLCQPPQRMPGSREREVAETSEGLLRIAKDEGIAMVALSQLNRECEKRADKRPIIADLRESGAIEQDASVIIFLYRDEVYNENSAHKGTVEAIIAKNRLGRTGTARMAFDKTCQRIADLENRYAADDE